MKTLDEVIKAFECCGNDEPDSNCEKCSYIGISCCLERDNDALHYLKEYKEHLKWHAYEEHCLDNEKKTLQEKKAEFDEVLTDYVVLRQLWTEQQENPPLSWEQLKQMEGKPIWIELLNHGILDDPSHRADSEWWVIGEVRKDDIILATYLDEMELCEEDIGVLWNAYRKERK